MGTDELGSGVEASRKTIVIVGASGIVGSRALTRFLARKDVRRVVALGRRELPLQHDKLTSMVLDLHSSEALAREIPDDVDIAVCCLGTTMKKAGSKEAFRAVDRDAVVTFGEAAQRKGASRFLLVSAIGADPHSKNFYLRTKGEAERALTQLGYPQLTVLRPSFIDDQGARTEFRLAERIGLPIARALFSRIGKTHRLAPIPADTLGHALVHLAFDETQDAVRVLESHRLHEVGSQESDS